MATITVTISPGEDPIRAEVKHGDTVVFLLSGYGADTTATVMFPGAASSSACFTDPGPFQLRPYRLVPPHRTVSPSASKGLHAFEVSIEPAPRQDGGGPPADRKNGGIDVTGDPREPAPR